MDQKIEGYREQSRRERAKVRVRTKDLLKTSHTKPETEVEGEPDTEPPEEGDQPQTETKEIVLEELIDRLKKHVTRVATSWFQVGGFSAVLKKEAGQLVRDTDNEDLRKRPKDESVGNYTRYLYEPWEKYWKGDPEVILNPYILFSRVFFGNDNPMSIYSNHGILHVLVVDKDHFPDNVIESARKFSYRLNNLQRPAVPSVIIFGGIAFDSKNTYKGTPLIKLDFEDSPEATQTREALVELLITTPAEVFRRIWSEICGWSVTTRSGSAYFSLLDDDAKKVDPDCRVRLVMTNGVNSEGEAVLKKREIPLD